jgi:hypothetical protein
VAPSGNRNGCPSSASSARGRPPVCRNTRHPTASSGTDVTRPSVSRANGTILSFVMAAGAPSSPCNHPGRGVPQNLRLRPEDFSPHLPSGDDMHSGTVCTRCPRQILGPSNRSSWLQALLLARNQPGRSVPQGPGHRRKIPIVAFGNVTRCTKEGSLRLRVEPWNLQSASASLRILRETPARTFPGKRHSMFRKGFFQPFGLCPQRQRSPTRSRAAATSSPRQAREPAAEAARQEARGPRRRRPRACQTHRVSFRVELKHELPVLPS